MGVHRAVLAVRLLREHPQLQYLGITASQRGVLVAAETQYSLQNNLIHAARHAFEWTEGRSECKFKELILIVGTTRAGPTLERVSPSCRARRAPPPSCEQEVGGGSETLRSSRTLPQFPAKAPASDCLTCKLRLSVDTVENTHWHRMRGNAPKAEPQAPVETLRSHRNQSIQAAPPETCSVNFSSSSGSGSLGRGRTFAAAPQ